MTQPAAHNHNQERDIYLPQAATIVRTMPLTDLERFFEVRLASGGPLGFMPGQFVEVSIPGLGESPISIASSPDVAGSFDLVVRRVGRLTDVMHRLGPNAPIGIRGPFGTTFPVEDGLKGKDVLFICGGIGLVPVRSAIHYVLQRRHQYGEVTILYGTKTPAERLFVAELRDWQQRSDVHFLDSVDRADASWRGNVGVITTLIPKIEMNPCQTMAIVCGPPVMYKFVLVELLSRGMTPSQIYVSLERRMKCGVGKCGHCQINGLYTCIDGPVFRLSAVGDVQEAI